MLRSRTDPSGESPKSCGAILADVDGDGVNGVFVDIFK